MAGTVEGLGGVFFWWGRMGGGGERGAAPSAANSPPPRRYARPRWGAPTLALFGVGGDEGAFQLTRISAIRVTRISALTRISAIGPASAQVDPEAGWRDAATRGGLLVRAGGASPSPPLTLRSPEPLRPPPATLRPALRLPAPAVTPTVTAAVTAAVTPTRPRRSRPGCAGLGCPRAPAPPASRPAPPRPPAAQAALLRKDSVGRRATLDARDRAEGGGVGGGDAERSSRRPRRPLLRAPARDRALGGPKRSRLGGRSVRLGSGGPGPRAPS